MRREPRVNDYVIWDRHGLSDEGWIYFVSEPTEQKKGFPTTRRYVTIEVGVKKKPDMTREECAELFQTLVQSGINPDDLRFIRVE